MDFSPLDIVLAAWQGIGISLLSGFLYTRLTRNLRAGALRDATVGLLFGFAGVAAMLSTIRAGDGVYVDVRDLMVGFGPMLAGGWGLLAAVPVMLMRWIIGGETAAGIGGVVLAAVIGLMIGRRSGYRDGSAPIGAFGIAGAFIALHLASASLMKSDQWLSVGLVLWAIATPVYALGAVLLGAVVRAASRNAIRSGPLGTTRLR